MVTEFEFPDVGEGITEGRIKEWLVDVGDTIEEDDTMARVETDKALVDMPSPADGVVLEIKVPAGEKVKVGQVMIVIGDEGEKVPEGKKGSGKTGTTNTETEGSETGTDKDVFSEGTQETSKSDDEVSEEASKGKVFALPRVRKLARDKGVDLSAIKGTGPKGRITEDDVKSVLEDREKKEVPPRKEKKKPAMKIKLNYDFYGHISYAPYKGLREVIGDKLTKSKFTAPHANAMEEVDMTALWDFRKGMNRELETDNEKLTFMPFIVRAVVKSLKAHPTLNSMLDEENEEIVLKDYYNIGVATDTKEGLMVPVVKRCEEKDLVSIQHDMDTLIGKARDRTIDLADLRGGTFTISNFGAVGGIFGVPIINYPEAAILGIGQIKEMPRVVDGEIVVRKVMGISLSFDHRIVDGAEVARFINTLKDYLENPGKLMA